MKKIIFFTLLFSVLLILLTFLNYKIEVIETKIYSIQEVKKLLKTNKINDMKTYISLDRFMNYY